MKREQKRRRNLEEGEIRECQDCGTEFSLGKARRWTCPSCHNVRSAASKYKITKERVIEMWDKENCDLCNNYMNRKNIDHCHKTGKVRGILCSNCNSGLGKFKDDIMLLYNAIEYLNKNK